VPAAAYVIDVNTVVPERAAIAAKQLAEQQLDPRQELGHIDAGMDNICRIIIVVWDRDSVWCLVLLCVAVGSTPNYSGSSCMLV
jgi:hypothetical protein